MIDFSQGWSWFVSGAVLMGLICVCIRFLIRLKEAEDAHEKKLLECQINCQITDHWSRKELQDGLNNYGHRLHRLENLVRQLKEQVTHDPSATK